MKLMLKKLFQLGEQKQLVQEEQQQGILLLYLEH